MEDPKLTVRAAERALDILLCFADSTDLSLTEIARRVSLHKSTVHRLLATLERKGFVLRDSMTDRYKLGYRVWELSANLVQSDEPALILLPEMEKLRDLIGETISLYVRDGNERIRIQAVQSSHSVRRVAPVGVRLPLSVGASSKVLIAWNKPIKREEGIYRDGYAMSFEEREPGANAIATPILNRSGKLVAALSVSGPANRWTKLEMQRYAPQILAFAERMGKMLK